MLAIGEPAGIARRYNELNFGATIHQATSERSDEQGPAGPQGAQIVDAWFEDSAGTRIAAMPTRHVRRGDRGPLQPRWMTRSSERRCATTSAPRCSHDDRLASPDRAFRGGRDAVVRLRLRDLFTQTRYT